MVTFNFIGGDSTFQERELMKETFLTNIKEFREEFESKEPFVTIDLRKSPTSSTWAEFTFGNDVDGLIDFIRRFQLAYPPKDKK
jgi:hypothetical protein